MRASPALNQEVNSLTQTLVSKLLPSESSEQLSQGAIAHTALAPIVHNLKNISARYVSPALAANKQLDSLDEAKAYALYYLPINYLKVRVLLNAIGIPPPRTVLDVGAGPGTGELAFQHHFVETPSCIAVEGSRAMREVRSLLLAESLSRPAFESVTVLPRASNFDCILLANVLNELPHPLDYVQHEILPRISRDGTLLVIEPGTPHATSLLMNLRDYALQAAPDLTAIFPCTHSSPCPMRAIPDAWCHTELSWERPPVIQQLDELTGFNKHRLKFSCLVLRRHAPQTGGLRILTSAHRARQGVQISVCGGEFFGTLIATKRCSSEMRQHIRRARTFDHLLDIRHKPGVVSAPTFPVRTQSRT